MVQFDISFLTRSPLFYLSEILFFSNVCNELDRGGGGDNSHMLFDDEQIRLVFLRKMCDVSS